MRKRNYGIDLFRMIAAFMVVFLHMFTIGFAIPQNWISFQGVCATTLQSFLYCAVNCFGLISGYVMFSQKVSMRKLVPLWAQVLFYSIGITLIFYFFHPEPVGKAALLHALFPISSKQWWYVSAYFGVVFLAPLMNYAVERLDRKLLTKCLLLLLLLACGISVLLVKDPTGQARGYSTFWLALMYLIGAYARKYECFVQKKKRSYVLTLCVSVMLTAGLSVLAFYLSKGALRSLVQPTMFLQFQSPLMLLSAICLLAIFVNLNIGPKSAKVISVISPTALGVYLLHIHPLILDRMLKGFARGFLNDSLLIWMAKILIAALVIFVSCTFVELLRIRIFKWLRMDRACNWISDKASAAFDRLYQKYIEK